MEYFRIKKRANRVRKNGTVATEMIWINKTKKFGKVTQEQHLTVKKPILITGGANAGKTRIIDRIDKHAKDIYNSTEKPSHTLNAIEPIGRWVDSKQLARWHEKKTGNLWRSMKNYEKIDALIEWVSTKKIVVIADNIHLLTGRKLETAKRCLRAASVWIATCIHENRISPSLRGTIMNREPQTIRLKTEAATDATWIFVYGIAALLAVSGNMQLAFVVLGLRMLSRGTRSSKHA